jgi:transposase
MAKAYSMDLRDRAVAAVRDGMSRHEAAKRFAVSVASVIRWCQLSDRTGSTKPGKLGGHRPRLLEGERDFVMARIAEKPDLTLAALLREVQARGTVVSPDTLWRFLRHCGHSFKKKHSAKRARAA